jgi:hypothetical protein
LAGRRRLRPRGFCFELLVKVIPDFLVKSVNLPQKYHHLSIELHNPPIERLHLLFQQINTKVNLLDLFPIRYFTSLFRTERMQFPYNLLCKLSVLMMLLQIIIFKKGLLTNLNKLFLHKELLSLDEFIQEAAINQSIQSPLKYCACVRIKRLQCSYHLSFELQELFNAPDLVPDRFKALLIPQSFKMTD